MTAAADGARDATRSGAARGGPAVRVLVAGIWLVAVFTALLGTLTWVFLGFPSLTVTFARGPENLIGIALLAITYATVGGLLAVRLPRNPIGWLLLVEGLLISSLTPVNLLMVQVDRAMEAPPHVAVGIAWLSSTFTNPVMLAVLIIVLLLFPDGRFLPGRWWIGGLLACAGAVLLSVALALDPTGLLWYPDLPNPVAVGREYGWATGLLRLTGALLLLGSIGVAAASSAARYRGAGPQTRLQFRWILFGVGASIAGLVSFLAVRYLLDVSEATDDLLMAFLTISVCLYPITIAIAINREHLYEIDAIISRTLVYVPLMGLLAGLYAASIAFFQRLFTSITGNTSDAAIILSSLMLAALFAPTRSALEAQVARHFKPVEAPGTAGASGVRAALPAGSDDAAGRDGPAAPNGADGDRLVSLERRVSELERRLVGDEGVPR